MVDRQIQVGGSLEDVRTSRLVHEMDGAGALLVGDGRASQTRATLAQGTRTPMLLT